MHKINRWFLGFFLVALWPSGLMLCAEEPARPAVPSQNVASPESETTTPGIDGAVQAAQEDVRDPFARPEIVVPVASVQGIVGIQVELQGIGTGSKGAYAVIGIVGENTAGHVYYKGDEKNGVKLLEVRKVDVDVLMNGEMVRVPFVFKKTPPFKVPTYAEVALRKKFKDQIEKGEDAALVNAYLRQRPVGQQPVGQQPVGQQPVGQQPVGQQPVGQQPSSST